MTRAPAVPRVDADATVVVSEMFLSHQGEGVNLGRVALFLRLMTCNLTCGWSAIPATAETPPEAPMVCDTRYTWDPAAFDPNKPVQKMSRTEIWDALCALQPRVQDSSLPRTDLLVVSGGEPLLNMPLLVWLADMAKAAGMQMEIETNATIAPSRALLATRVRFNAGLKLSNSGVLDKKRLKPDAIRALQDSGRARWKFVVTSLADVEEVVELRELYRLTEVWLSPEGTDVGTLLERTRLITPRAAELGFHMTSRLHVLAYGDRHGV